MTNPIQLLEQKLDDIKDVEEFCIQNDNKFDLGEIQRQKQMYLSSIHILKEYLNDFTLKELKDLKQWRQNSQNQVFSMWKDTLGNALPNAQLN